MPSKAPPTCKERGCGQYVDKKGLCAMHFHKRGEQLDEDDLIDRPPQFGDVGGEGGEGGEGAFKLSGKLSKDLSSKMAVVFGGAPPKESYSTSAKRRRERELEREQQRVREAQGLHEEQSGEEEENNEDEDGGWGTDGAEERVDGETEPNAHISDNEEASTPGKRRRQGAKHSSKGGKASKGAKDKSGAGFKPAALYNRIKPCAVPGCGGALCRDNSSYCTQHRKDMQKADRKKLNCSQEGCETPGFLGGLCATHYLDMDAVTSLAAPQEDSNKNKFAFKVEDEAQTVWQQLTTSEGVDYFYNTETNETTWEKPEELMTASELDQRGEWFWIPHPIECFVPAKLEFEGVRGVVTCKTADGSTVEVKRKEMIPLQSRSGLNRVVDDLVLLDEMSPPLILHCLKQRFQQQKIYTSVGTILISINPYQMLPLYTPQVIKRYASRAIQEILPPHVYNIAHDSYYGLTQFKHNQSIIISGESGAGKTEATKQCLNYLASLAGSAGGVEKKVLQANPVLEAFGNAKTLRNDNSSRFGKYLEIFFDTSDRIACSNTRNYLLEKIRVIHQAHQERNFHIFYQLTKSSSHPAIAKWFPFLQPPSAYAYTKTCTDVNTIDDLKDFNEVVQAFEDLGFSGKEVKGFFSVVALVLLLGNVEFAGPKEKATVADGSREDMERAATLLGVESAALERVLGVRELRIRGQATTDVFMSRQQALATRDALSKYVYGKMFDLLVATINTKMRAVASQEGRDSKNMIGILDIFGFEIFQRNTFEQLCINFTNEMLQQHFNNQTFKLEEAVYEAEKISFTHIAFIDNQPMLDLITKRPHGVLPLLDEELIVPNGSDNNFLEKLDQAQQSNRVYEQCRSRAMHFAIRHYAGLVQYDCTGFMEKNTDALTTELVEMLQASSAPLLQAMFPPADGQEGEEDRGMRAKERKSSLSAKFQGQLRSLMTALNLTEPHYIRCIKPNDDKSASKFVPRNCHEQLMYSGVFEAVAIRKQGFPFRLSHQDFVKRYCCVTDDYEATRSMPALQGCLAIVNAMKLDEQNVQQGKTRMLYRADEHRNLELLRSIKIKKIEVVEHLSQLAGVKGEELPFEAQEAFFLKLAAAVREADKFRLSTGVAEEARARLERWVENRMDAETKRALQEALETKSRRKLEDVLAECDEKGFRTKMIVQCQEMLLHVIEVEACLTVARARLEEECLGRALQRAAEAGLAEAKGMAVLVRECKALKRQIGKVVVAASAALRQLSHTALQRVLDLAASFGYKTRLTQSCATMLGTLKRVRKTLKMAVRDLDRDGLMHVLEECDKMGYSDALVTQSRGLADRIGRIGEEATKARKGFDNGHLRAVVLAAAEIGLLKQLMRPSTRASSSSKGGKGGEEDDGEDDVSACARLLGTSQDALLKKQFKRAVKKGRHVRAVQIAIKRKEIYMAKHAKRFPLEEYECLKDPLQWAKERWFAWGSSHQTKAKGMLSWQREALHSPLTTINRFSDDRGRRKLLTSKIQACFETVQKVMGQRQASDMSSDMYELLQNCLLFPELRSDVLLGLLKQMTKNPDFRSVQRGWHLLALCLTVFAPTEDFENYLEAFMRSDPGVAKELCLPSLLRHRAYHGSTSPKNIPRFYRGFKIEQMVYQRTPEYLRKAEGGEEGKEEVAMFSKEDTKEGSTYKDLVDSFYQGGYSKALREQVLALEKKSHKSKKPKASSKRLKQQQEESRGQSSGASSAVSCSDSGEEVPAARTAAARQSTSRRGARPSSSSGATSKRSSSKQPPPPSSRDSPPRDSPRRAAKASRRDRQASRGAAGGGDSPASTPRASRQRLGRKGKASSTSKDEDRLPKPAAAAAAAPPHGRPTVEEARRRQAKRGKGGRPQTLTEALVAGTASGGGGGGGGMGGMGGYKRLTDRIDPSAALRDLGDESSSDDPLFS